MQLGKAIKRLRESQGLTQVDLAAKLSVTNVTICNWESSARLPSLDRVDEIAEALGVRPAELFMDEEESAAVKAAMLILNSARDRYMAKDGKDAGYARDNSHGIEHQPAEVKGLTLLGFPLVHGRTIATHNGHRIPVEVG